METAAVFRAVSRGFVTREDASAICGRETRRGTKKKKEREEKRLSACPPVTLTVSTVQRVRTPILKIAVSISESLLLVCVISRLTSSGASWHVHRASERMIDEILYPDQCRQFWYSCTRFVTINDLSQRLLRASTLRFSRKRLYICDCICDQQRNLVQCTTKRFGHDEVESLPNCQNWETLPTDLRNNDVINNIIKN